MKYIRVLSPYISRGNYQFFILWFFKSCLRQNITVQKGLSIHWLVRLAIAKLRVSFNISHITFKNKALIVLGAGYIDSFAWPFAYNCEIIPVLWDTWPKYWPRLVASLKRHHVKYAFFTQSQVAKMIEQEIPEIKCFHLLEGIDLTGYKKGDILENRTIDLLELGRIYTKFHTLIDKTQIPLLKEHLFRTPEDGLLFPDFESLTHGLSNAKVTVCFPRCDTHPLQAKNIETMTQRYWECMLSRTLILGRAPKELIDFAGYNPVIDVDWNNLPSQIEFILSNIRTYQNLVDNNYRFALRYASWDNRVKKMLSLLHENGYRLKK
ncbi:hypothetical protein [Parabacteroides sp. AF17-28]|uniref:hypothetical protein n=1 Tax=Parabacteroides sp. AF17-28 TaxID=2292241 RepID=UPI000F004ED1|nr:hypothetical protein [Parabacteroides sp. AF17-28]RHR52618.1 hypothetical protein DWW90_17480 [Parabacteroides sp. AF17-28]